MSGTTSGNEWQRITTSYNKWQWVVQQIIPSDEECIASDNEWYQMTANDNDSQPMTASGTANENEWKQVK